MTYLLFSAAFALSVIAAYYSVVGMMAIFSAAMLTTGIMFTVLEYSKLVLVSYLTRKWGETPLALKVPFVISIIVLMCLTSLGIFGGLSKAHLDQSAVSGDVTAKLALIDEKIKTQKENINAARKTLQQLDQQVDQLISRTTDEGGVSRSTIIRRSQNRERQALLSEIGASQKEVARLNEERAPIAAEVRKVEVEVGPIKYVAALLYEDNPQADTLEKAVRFLILSIVAVFDPLAILMFITLNQNRLRRVEEPITVQPEIVDEIVEEEESENKKTLSMFSTVSASDTIQMAKA